MQNVFLINKKEGETPLQCLESFRASKKIGKDVLMTYAGRLDPMASGLMILLAGEECKNKEKYLGLDKEYEFSVLFGFATDTYDILGKVVDKAGSASLKFRRVDELSKLIKKNLKFFKGKFMQKYPMYSSKTVEGKQLHAYARGGEDVNIPEHEVEVKSLKFIKLSKISREKLLKNIETRIAKVKGDFRQKEILKLWKKELKKPQSFFVAHFRVKCGSGTYVRAIANDLGGRIGVPALALSIKRTKIGKYDKLK